MARVLCVEVGYTTIKLCEMEDKAKNPKVYQCIELPTPQGGVLDGYLLGDKVEEIKQSIQNALKEYRIRTKKVIFSVYSSKIITREVMLPPVKKNQIQNVIMTNISEYFPIEPYDYVITYSVITPCTEGVSGDHHKVLVIAAEKFLLRGYERLAELCGLHMVNIDYTGNAVYQAVKVSSMGQTQMLVKVEPEGALVSIIKDGNFVLQRAIPYGMGNIADTEQEMKSVLEPLIGTLLRIIDFYTAREENEGIAYIHIMGKCAEYDVVTKRIGAETGLECRRLNTLADIRLQPAAEDAKLFQFVACIGASYAPVGMLENNSDKQETDYFHVSVLLLVFFMVSAGALCALSILPYQEQQMRQQELKRLEETYLVAKPIYEKCMALTELHKHIDYGYKRTEHANDGLLDFLEELEEKLPSDVSVEEFHSDDEQATITMTVADKETAAGVIEKLRAFDSLMSVRVTDIVENAAGEMVDTTGKLEVRPTTVSFTVYGIYYPAELEAPLSAQEVAEGVEAQIIE